MPPRFVEDGYDTPFFVINYSKSFTLWGIAYLMILPLLYTLHKICQGVELWSNISGSYFWNMPLRTLVEIYIEMVVNIFLNL